MHLCRSATLKLTVASLALVLFAAPPSRAENDRPVEEVKGHAARAKVHYDLGEFEQAAEEYILAYRIKPIPALLFNIAQAYRRGGQYEKARQFYETCVRESADKKVKEACTDAGKKVAELLAKERNSREAPPTGVAQEPGGLTSPARTASMPPPPIPAPAAQAPVEAKKGARQGRPSTDEERFNERWVGKPEHDVLAQYGTTTEVLPLSNGNHVDSYHREINSIASGVLYHGLPWVYCDRRFEIDKATLTVVRAVIAGTGCDFSK